MNYKQKLIQRHKNPIGLVLRLVTYIALCYSMWMHNISLLLMLIILDILNWFFMPMVNPKMEQKIVNKVVETEIDWIKSPLNLIKCFSIIMGLGLFILLGIGLWKHNWILLTMAVASISILKHLILKITSNQ